MDTPFTAPRPDAPFADLASAHFVSSCLDAIADAAEWLATGPARPLEPTNPEIARLPIGTRVKVRGCPGLGVGVVAGHVIAGSSYRTFVEAVEVDMTWLDEGRPVIARERFKARELFVVGGAS